MADAQAQHQAADLAAGARIRFCACPCFCGRNPQPLTPQASLPEGSKVVLVPPPADDDGGDGVSGHQNDQPETKWCRGCRKDWPVEEFPRNRGLHFGCQRLYDALMKQASSHDGLRDRIRDLDDEQFAKLLTQFGGIRSASGRKRCKVDLEFLLNEI